MDYNYLLLLILLIIQIVLVIVIVIILVFAALIVALNNIGLINFDKKKKKKAELNYTTTNTKQKGDCITFETSEDFVTTFVEEQNNGTFIYNLSFKREGKYNFKASVEKFDVVTQIEVNNTLYDQLKVA